MKEHGYPLPFAVGLTGASSTIGPIIPPSLPMVIYGVSANASVGQLFAAGLIPGLVMALTLMGAVAWVAHTQGFDRDAQFRWARLGYTAKRAFLPLMTPVLLVGGMTSGAFTPTEAAIAATFYALILGLVVYRSLTWRGLLRVTMETIETTAVVLLIVAGASIFGWLITTTRVTEEIAAAVLSITREPWMVLLLVNILLLIVGCFLETIAAITILVPVLLPIMMAIGVDPVHFGIIMVLNLMIGLLTPPVGMVLFILARVSGLTFEQTARACAPLPHPALRLSRPGDLLARDGALAADTRLPLIRRGSRPAPSSRRRCRGPGVPAPRRRPPRCAEAPRCSGRGRSHAPRGRTGSGRQPAGGPSRHARRGTSRAGSMPPPGARSS
jgi:tripartite ATP-independent transporter DctM subunit